MGCGCGGHTNKFQQAVREQALRQSQGIQPVQPKPMTRAERIEARRKRIEAREIRIAARNEAIKKARAASG